MLTRDQLFGSFKRRYRIVRTIAGDVRIQNLTEDEKSNFEAGGVKSDGKVNLAHVRSQRRRLIAACLVDGEGQLLLDKADVDRLRSVDAAVTSAIMAACLEHCGFNADEQEELEKNFAAAGGDDLPIASPSTTLEL